MQCMEIPVIDDRQNEILADPSIPLAPIFQVNSPKISTPKEHSSAKRQVPCDGRNKSPSSTYSKWEMRYEWAYFNNSKNGWFCKICEQSSNTGDAYWKTLPHKHDEHPSQFIHDHDNSPKHLQAVTNKTEVQSMLSKGAIFKQISDGAKSQSTAQKERNR